ncbi:unnamed protein product [Polarella glacialis]|uniref:CBS domain-containing protein n=1 Tax=Polarella glacialis TaxID=89957 RepID=A0A813G897_POLGL|nr:unnamed protein product [Polarella glacialis]
MSVDGLDADTIFNAPCLGYGLEDLLALPSPSAHQAQEVDLTVPFTKTVTLMSPFVSAPMDTVTEAHMAIACALMGGIGVIHANCDPEQQAKEVDMVKRYENGFIMDPHVLGPNDRVEDVDRIRATHDVSTVMITDGGVMGNRFLGIVTSRDIDFVENRKTKLSDVMTPKAKVLFGTEPISLGESQQKLIASKKGKLPILNEGGELVAVVSRGDLKKSKNFPLASKDANRQLLVAAAVVPKPSEMERVRLLVEAGVDVIVLDAQSGGTSAQVDFLKKVKHAYPGLDVICGNVVTPRQAKVLIDAGADALRVGMGCSSLNSAHEVGVIGRPQGSAVYHVARYAASFGVPVIADGGINGSSAASMALTLGASTVMCGSLMAGTTESPGDAFFHDCMRLKLYRGNGSLEVMPAQIEKAKYSQGGENAEIKRVPGGTACAVVDRGPVKALLASLLEGVKRDFRRLGVSNVRELHEDLYGSKTRFHVRSAGAYGAAHHGSLA